MTEPNPPATMPAPTQVRRPWNAVARTLTAVGAGMVAALPFLPDVIRASGLEQTAFGAGALGVVAAVTRILAVPGVNAWLRDHVPFLSAEGRR